MSDWSEKIFGLEIEPAQPTAQQLSCRVAEYEAGAPVSELTIDCFEHPNGTPFHNRLPEQQGEYRARLDIYLGSIELTLAELLELRPGARIDLTGLSLQDVQLRCAYTGYAQGVITEQEEGHRLEILSLDPVSRKPSKDAGNPAPVWPTTKV